MNVLFLGNGARGRRRPPFKGCNGHTSQSRRGELNGCVMEVAVRDEFGLMLVW